MNQFLDVKVKLEQNHMYFYVHIPDGNDSTYQACNRNVKIDPKFHRQLQEEEETGDISRFLALPEII